MLLWQGFSWPGLLCGLSLKAPAVPVSVVACCLVLRCVVVVGGMSLSTAA
jgi:hypothetical protein